MIAILVKLQDQVDEIRSALVLCKRAVSNGSIVAPKTLKVFTPDPKTFSESRDAWELYNFLWQMERGFEAISLRDEKAKLNYENATLWWPGRHADIERGSRIIDAWEDFKKEIKGQFYLKNVEYLDHKNLKLLRHTRRYGQRPSKSDQGHSRRDRQRASNPKEGLRKPSGGMNGKGDKNNSDTSKPQSARECSKRKAHNTLVTKLDVHEDGELETSQSLKWGHCSSLRG
ncbi:hypothetical protein AMTR_s00070p00177670 [Amborella trichopoda]|uniref:Retrotransposon gag domain-containing protein n=1 Tax=Amborella trichopoda TaxID=13333 RepID=U5DEM5_AMBTC|nr:hypothetical protein AMTR_s00070p00177670 [Amborella trichopoda]